MGSPSDHGRERLLRLLAMATFIIFFQAYMVAPIIPTLSVRFHVPASTTGLIVPAYLIPYGIATLAYGLLADLIGIHKVMYASLATFVILTIGTVSARSIEQLAFWRLYRAVGIPRISVRSCAWPIRMAVMMPLSVFHLS